MALPDEQIIARSSDKASNCSLRTLLLLPVSYANVTLYSSPDLESFESAKMKRYEFKTTVTHVPQAGVFQRQTLHLSAFSWTPSA